MSLVFAAPAPVTVPVDGGGSFPVRRIYCVGRNYAEHAQEMGFTGREPPFFFMKPADALVPVLAGETGTMAYPSLTRDLHHEVELVVAIGVGGIFGHAVGLDMTRRDLQGEMKKQGRPWEIGKSFEQSAPIGPIVPIGGTGALDAGAITLDVNDERRQSGDLKGLIWKVSETLDKLRQAWSLAPGDLVFTGTPANFWRKWSVQSTSNPQLAGCRDSTVTPRASNHGTQAPSDPSFGQLAPPKARMTASAVTVLEPSGISKRNARGPSHPHHRCRTWMTNPAWRSRRSQARRSGAAFISVGNTRPDDPMKVSMPKSRAQARNAPAPKAASRGSSCFLRRP